jgi:hypothetical protein
MPQISSDDKDRLEERINLISREYEETIIERRRITNTIRRRKTVSIEPTYVKSFEVD